VVSSGYRCASVYFVRELLAAFALFALGFVVIGLCLATFYLLQKSWEAGVGRVAASQIRGSWRRGAAWRQWKSGAGADPASGFGTCPLILLILLR